MLKDDKSYKKENLELKVILRNGQPLGLEVVVVVVEFFWLLWFLMNQIICLANMSYFVISDPLGKLR